MEYDGMTVLPMISLNLEHRAAISIFQWSPSKVRVDT